MGGGTGEMIHEFSLFFYALKVVGKPWSDVFTGFKVTEKYRIWLRRHELFAAVALSLQFIEDLVIEVSDFGAELIISDHHDSVVVYAFIGQSLTEENIVFQSFSKQGVIVSLIGGIRVFYKGNDLLISYDSKGILSDNGLNFVEVLTEIGVEAYKGGFFSL